jgi:hypothetical protein
MAQCTSCSVAVLWVKLEPRLSPHPLNVQPSITGNIRMLGSRRATARVLKKAELEEARTRGELLYTSHFATCAHAAQHRQKSALPSSAEKPKAVPPPQPSRPNPLSCVATSDGSADLFSAITVRP